MNKGLLIGIAIVVLLILGFGVYKVTVNTASKGNQAATQDTTAEPQKTDQGTEDSKAPSSLRELFSLGRSQRCTFSTTTDETTTDGTMFIASGKMRGDIATTTLEKSINSHMIASNKEVYIWVDGETNGMKMTFDPNQIQDEEAKQKTVDLDEKVDYRCDGWAGDPSLFEVPASVTFTDLQSVMVIPTGASGGSGGATGGNESACAACDSLDGEAKTQCQTALSCR